MKCYLAGLTLAGALLMPTSSARASGSFTYDIFCGGSGLGGFCAQPTLQVSDLGSGLFRVVLSVTNASGAATGTNAAAFITNVGIDNLLPGTVTLAGTPNFSAVINGVGQVWTLSQNVHANGNSTLKFDADAPGADHSFTTGRTGVFSFTVLGDFTPSSTNPAFYFKAQGLSNPPSIECETTNAGAFDGDGLAACSTLTHITATPEPASMTLLGTGILGILGAYRRRKNAAA